MKRILTAALLFAAPAAFAQVDATEIEAGEVGESAKENLKEWGKQADVIATNEQTMKADQAFQLQGKVERATRERLTIAREGLPRASLDIRNDTEVMLDGRKAKASELKDGMDITAHFQLEGREIVAVKVDAKSGVGMGGAGEAGKELDKKNKSYRHDKDK